MFSKSSRVVLQLLCFFLALLNYSLADSASEFIKCVSIKSDVSVPLVTTLFTQKSSSYASIFNSTAQNLRFNEPSVPKPDFIFTPLEDSHVQAAVICARSLGLHVRVRSGGHDYEGVSYASRERTRFLLLDLINLRQVHVDIEEDTAWIQAGATTGEVYYRIAQKSKVRGFPAGIWTTLGIGGHITGGAYGSLLRKYGLAADNVVDAMIVDAKGEILNREAMGEDLFWAIRGGGGGSFGVILWWKIKLVPVPKTVVVFRIRKTVEQGATKILVKWQEIADKLEEDLFLKVTMLPTNSSLRKSQRTVATDYEAAFLGRTEKLLAVMRKSFPELGVKRSDCTEMSWFESVLFLKGYPIGTPVEIVLSEKPTFQTYFKAKSDFAKSVIPEIALEGLWRMMLKEDNPVAIWTPFGGAMSKISESQTPYPHRNGVKFMIQYLTIWQDGERSQKKHLDWIKEVYEYMTPFVSSNPRESYVNYRDLDLGMNNNHNKSNFEAAIDWGTRYFKNNFFRLASVKTKVDPDNFFRHEQSIPVKK